MQKQGEPRGSHVQQKLTLRDTQAGCNQALPAWSCTRARITKSSGLCLMQTLLGDGEDRREAQEEGGTRGEKVGAKMQQEIDVKGFKLVVTGHSLGAGAAALISLKLRDSFDSEARSLGCLCLCSIASCPSKAG